MKSGKKISELFQEGSIGLTIQPSSQAWQKLESRLEGQPKQSGKVVSMRWLMAIAAMFVLIAGMFFINNEIGKNNIAFGNEPAPSNLQDLVNTDGCNPFCLLLKERNELPSYYANPVRK